MKNWGIHFPAVSHVLFFPNQCIDHVETQGYRGNEYIYFNFF